MPQAVNCMPILFADDTWLIFSVPDLISLIKIIKKELQSLSIWFDSNKLTANPSKSNFLIVPPKLNKPFPQTNVFLHNISIPQYKSIKYLGLNIDMNLNFDSHTSNIVYTVKYQERLELSLKSDIITQKKHY